MIKFLNKAKLSVVATLGLVLFTFNSVAQPTQILNTAHTYNNSSSHVIFNVQNTNPYAINITEFRTHALSAGAATTVLYNPTPYSNFGTWSSGIVGAGQNGWILVGNGTTAASGAVTPYLTGTNLVSIPAGATYQFCLAATSTGYMTLTAGTVNTYSTGGVNILTGDGISWGGGALPATPVNYPRGFVGGISFVQGLPLLSDDAGITGFVNPLIPTCSFNDSISVTLKNFGTDTLTSASIGWKKNTTTYTPILWTGSLPPYQSTTVFVGTAVYAAGDDLKAWTSLPNMTIEPGTGALNDTASLFNLTTGLSGIYTVGGSGPDFPDMATAIAALDAAGICGPITFNVRTGTYNQPFVLSQVVGMNATNTVTIRSEVGHRDSVVYEFVGTSAANNWVVRLNNADYYNLEHMTLRNTGASFGRALVIEGGSERNNFSDLLLQTNNVTSTSNNLSPLWSATSLDHFNTFDGCTFKGGSYGAYWYGSSTSSLEEGVIFTNNEFEDNYYMGLYSWYQKNSLYDNNHIFGNSAYASRYGLYVGYNQNGVKVTNNFVESNPTSYFFYGMYIYYSDATASNRGLIANNRIIAGKPGVTSAIYGLNHYYSGFNDVYNNSVNIIGGAATSRAAYLYYGGANNVQNNNFVSNGPGFSVYLVSPYTLNLSDNNNFKTSGTVLGYYNTANTNTLADWQAASSQDANSVSVNPGYHSDYDLHVCSDSINGMGAPVAAVTVDMDGQVRNTSTPDIGADEFAPIGTPGFLGSDVTICTGDSVTLLAGSPSDAILWSNMDTTTTTVISTPGTYNVSIIGACGLGFDTIVVNASALTYTNFVMADTTVFCTGGSVLLTATMPALTYSWTGGTTDDSLVVTNGGLIVCNITDACGTGTQSVTITEQSAPTAGYTSIVSWMSAGFTNTSTSPASGTTYLWNFGDATTSSEVSPAHIYSAYGTYTVTLTVTNDCGSNTYTNVVEIIDYTGIEDLSGLGTIGVYPNPSNGLFNVDFNLNNDVNATIQVTNVLGETVYTKALGTIHGVSKSSVDISTVAPGVYYVTVLSNDKKVYTNMVVKQ